jgi:hypothetical protein
LVFQHFERRNSDRLALALEHRTVLKFANSCLSNADGFVVQAPAPKPVEANSGSPFLAAYLLKIKGLTGSLVVARSEKMWLRMHRVPRIFTIVKERRNSPMGSSLLDVRRILVGDGLENRIRVSSESAVDLPRLE